MTLDWWYHWGWIPIGGIGGWFIAFLCWRNARTAMANNAEAQANNAAAQAIIVEQRQFIAERDEVIAQLRGTPGGNVAFLKLVQRLRTLLIDQPIPRPEAPRPESPTAWERINEDANDT